MSAQSDTIAGAELESGKAVVEGFLQAGVAGWGVLIGKDVGFEPGETRLMTPTEALGEAGGGMLISTISMSGERQGRLYLLVPEAGAKSIVAPMLALMDGSDKRPEDVTLDGDGMDAYNEAVNNLVGAAAQALRQEIAPEIKLTNENTRLVDLQASSPAVELGGKAMVCHEGRVTVEGSEPFALHLLLETAAAGLGDESVSAAGDAAGGEGGGSSDKEYREILQAHAMKLKVPVRVVLARKKFRMEVLRSLSPGSIIEFRKQSSEHLDLLVGNIKIAEGEVIITRQHFGIQLKKLVDVRAALLQG